MKKILLSMTLLIMSSGVALASNGFQTIRAEGEISSVPRFINHSRVQTQVARDNHMDRRVIHARYTPRQSMRQRHQRVQKRVYHPPRVQPRTKYIPRRIQRVQPQPRGQYRNQQVSGPIQRVQPQFNPNSRFAQAQRAAKMGNPNAEFDLAMMYANGDGVQKNPRVAFNLFHRAARKGHVGAKYCMGVNFEKGLGVIKQPELARHWYGIAAKAGHKQAQYKLAQLSQQSNQSQFRNVRYSRR